MTIEKWQILTSHISSLGEGPVWDDRENRILWVDIEQGHIHLYSPKAREHRILHTGELIGAVALRENGGLIAVLQSGFAIVDPETGAVEKLADPESQMPSNRFNDGKCDPQGRFWAGTMSVRDTPGAGNLYVLEPDFSVSIKKEKVTCSNGMAWSPDGSILYYIDTPTRQVVAFDFDSQSGTISSERVVVEVAEEHGFPDGMTIDSEGMLWIGLWDGWKVARFDPRSGKLIHQIPLPVSRVTSCTFGGDKLQDMYITSARMGLSEGGIAEQPLSGSVFVIKDCGFTGLAASRFKG